MNELSTTEKYQLPQTIEEKTAYVLFGSDALNAYRKKLKAVQTKYGISSEQYKQIQLEAQETAENLLLFSADIGKEMTKIEQTKGNRYSLPSTSGSTKTQTIHSMGFTDRQARDFQTLAKHPESVQRAIKDARKEDRIVTRQDVFHDISNVEHPTRRQKEAQELREAKNRSRDYQDTGDKIANFTDVKQHKNDNELIFKEFKEEVRKTNMSILHTLMSPDDPIVAKAIRATDRRELIALNDQLSECYRMILKLQRKIVEVIDEKQSK